MISTSKITGIFCLIDDFTIEIEKAREGHLCDQKLETLNTETLN